MRKYYQEVCSGFIGVRKSVIDNLDFSNAANIAEDLMKKFIDKEYDIIEIVYNRFKTVIST